MCDSDQNYLKSGEMKSYPIILMGEDLRAYIRTHMAPYTQVYTTVHTIHAYVYESCVLCVDA